MQASELEAKRLKKVHLKSTRLTVWITNSLKIYFLLLLQVTNNNKEIQLAKSMFALTPSEIGEAYVRFQKCILPAISYKVRAEKLRRLNNQY